MTLHHLAIVLLFGTALGVAMVDAYLPRILEVLFADTSAQDFDQ